jgi:hypothetical protein
MKAIGSPAAAQLPLSGLLISFNEIANIDRTLVALSWIPDVVVIDSGSTDGTLDVLAAHTNVRVIQRRFDSFAEQCNFGLDQIHSDWVLSLDADYGVPAALAAAMPGLITRADREGLAGYALPFRYCIDGQPLRGSLLPPRTCLYRTRRGRYRNEGHGHRVVLDGPVAPLTMAILHDDRKPLARWLASQQRYLTIEAANLLDTPPTKLSPVDRLRRHTPLAPLAALLVCLLGRGGLLDGAAGLTYALQRTYAELLLLLLLREEKGRRRAMLSAKGAGRGSGPDRRESGPSQTRLR